MTVKKTLKFENEEGVAILMVMTSITILALLLANFTFETKINRLKVYNTQERLQARLNAEAGIKFALAKLRLYQEGFNMLEKQKQLKDMLSPGDLEKIVTQPFIYPIDPGMLKNVDIIQRKAVEQFTENVTLQGKLTITMQSVSGFLNPNTLRVIEKVDHTGQPIDQSRRDDDQQEEEEDENKLPPHKYVEKKLLETLSEAINTKIEEDEEFAALYSNVDPELLVKELKYWVNAKGKFNDPLIGEIESLYQDKEIVPKHAPMTSISEMYLLAGWDDAIVDLVIDRLTVHKVTIIPLNEITSGQLKVLFPEATEDQLLDFFKYRDGDQADQIDPHPFKSVAEFKDVIVNRYGIAQESEYDSRVKEFETAGIKLGVAGKLFKVSSQGEYGRAKYSLNAYIDLPVKPEPPPKKKNPDDPNDPNREKDPNDPDGDGETNDTNDTNDPNDPNAQKKKPVPTELLQPRVIEIQVG